MSKHKGLGRGLDALLGGNAKARGEDSDLALIPVESLRPGKYQPRTHMDEASLNDLAESIRARGVIQPIVVRPVGDSQYEILAGERRWRAARIAGLDRIAAVVRDVPDEAALGIGLIENIQREDLNPIEEASGLKRLIDEFHLTHEEVARAIGRSRAGVTNLLRLLELAPAVQEFVQDGALDMGHARALLALSRPRQVEVAHQVVLKGLSVRETERLVAGLRRKPRRRRRVASAGSSIGDCRRLQEELSESPRRHGAASKPAPRWQGQSLYDRVLRAWMARRAPGRKRLKQLTMQCCGAANFLHRHFPACYNSAVSLRWASPIEGASVPSRWQVIATAGAGSRCRNPGGVGTARYLPPLGGAVSVVAGWVYGWRAAQGETRTAAEALRTMLRAEAIEDRS